MTSKLSLFSAAFASACLLSVYFFRPAVSLVLGLVFLCAFLPLQRWWAEKRFLRPAALGLACGFLWFSAYSALFYAPARALEGRTIRLEAVVTGWPVETNYGFSVPIRGGEAEGRATAMSIYLNEEYGRLRPGDSIRCVAFCSEATPSQRARGTYLFAKAYGGVTVTEADSVSPRYYPVYLSGYIQAAISFLYQDESSAALLAALITGNQRGISTSDSASFSRSGLSHVVAISGMHISFLAGALTQLFGRERKWSVAVQITVIFFFAIMAGSGPGALRAAMLCSANLVAPLLGRRTEPFTCLLSALLVLLLLNPYAIAGVSLQLSFAATFGIYLIANPLYEVWREKLPEQGRRFTALPLSILSVTLGAMLFTTPLTALYFDQVSLIAPFANLITNWAVSLSFLGGILSVVAGLLWLPLGSLVAAVVTVPIGFFLASARLVARLPFAAVTLQSVYFKAFLVFLYVIIFLYILSWRRGNRRVLLPACACSIALCLSILLTSLTVYGTRLTVTVLDVGQGQSIVMASASFRGMIDCGGDQYAGSTAADYLHLLGYDSLDLLILTHYDEDHIGGVPQLMSQVTVRAIALPDMLPDTTRRLEIEALARAYGTELWYIETETTVPFGHGELTLFPPVGTGLGQSNELGLTILCALDNWRALVTGDMDSFTERLLVQTYSLPDIDLLVLGHHGSKHSTSVELLEAVTPEIGVISVGANNNYGHPAPETLERASDYGITLYRTDWYGTITISVR